jgi:hypothetical protein
MIFVVVNADMLNGYMKVLDLFAESRLGLDELFMGAPKETTWSHSEEIGVQIWRTKFKFLAADRQVDVHIELVEDFEQTFGKYLFKSNGMAINPNAKGFITGFAVDGSMDITGSLGTEAAKLIGEVLSRCMYFWNQHSEFSYVGFSAAEQSRIKLYAAMSRRLAAMASAKTITSRGDFLIYLPEAENTSA